MINGYEIGTTFPGIPTAEQEVELLDAVLDKYGRCLKDWIEYPEMYHGQTLVYPETFYSSASPLAVDPPRWGFRGILRYAPEDTTNVLVEGVRARRCDTYSPDLV